jgi:transposase InsO family protein
LNISVHEAEKLSLEAIGRFVEAIEDIRFTGQGRQQVYGWLEQVLVQQEYCQQGKAARGLVRRYIEKMTGLSRAQVTRLISRYTSTGRVQPTVYRRRRFPDRYTRADIELLASVDEAHETLSGPATRRILEREAGLYGKQEYARLAGISVAHLYNLRKSQRYRERRLNYVKTRPTAVSIGERRKPDPRGQPGYLRLDTVHQGDQPDAKGVFHINAVDEVLQGQVVGATPRISEAYLKPVLEDMMRQFPFRIRGFHTDNGSEFINRTVAELLNKLLIEQTKSRPRQSGDNGLVETKNGAVIRKHIGYGYIDAAHADRINSFYRAYLNPYLNYHRPCAQADVQIDEKGRKRVRYRRYQTPLETLLALDKPAQFLRQGLSINALKRIAAALSDTEAARRMQQAKNRLFEKLRLTAWHPRLEQRAEEMTVHGKACGDKTPHGFSKNLGNRESRFPHSLRPGCDH